MRRTRAIARFSPNFFNAAVAAGGIEALASDTLDITYRLSKKAFRSIICYLDAPFAAHLAVRSRRIGAVAVNEERVLRQADLRVKRRAAGRASRDLGGYDELSSAHGTRVADELRPRRSG